MDDNAPAEIIGFGIVAVDDIVMVDVFPEPDTKQRSLSKRRAGGGQTATAMVAASRLGCSCRWVGVLGDNDLSDFAREVFRRENIACASAPGQPEAEPIHSMLIVTEDGSRTILWNDANAVAPIVGPEEGRWIDGAKCLFVDQVFPRAQLAASLRAVRAGVPIVSDIEYIDDDIVGQVAELTDHFIIPASAAARVFGETDPAAALAKALRLGRKSLACITDGQRGSWYATADRPDEVCHQPALRAGRVVDTNGCGDVFHGAYAAALVKELPPAERLRWAAGAAALKTLKAGGQDGAPTLRELTDFLLRH